MNQVNEKIQIEEIVNKSRQLDPKELMVLLKQDISVFWSWGVSKLIVNSHQNCRMLRMTVSGHHHKGWVFIFLNGMDLFDVYLTSNRGTIKKIMTELYFDQLVEQIDIAVERISEYQS